MSKRASWKLGAGRDLVVTLGIALAVFGTGCGDDAAAGAGCTTDVECKGIRICIDRQCVDPGSSIEADGGESSNTTDAGAVIAADGGGGNAVVDDPELEAACGDDCKAKQAAGCTMNIGSLDQCLGQCLVVDEQSPYCLDERTAHYACLAAGGYTCTSGYPQPKSTCIAEAQALSECTQKAPCRGYCARAAGDCAPAGDACITACEEEQASFDDAICRIYYQQLLTCWGRDLVCESGKAVSTMCDASLAGVADCVGRRNDECDGFCWAADTLGCGSTSCASECRVALEDASCGSYYRNVLDCAFSSHQLQMSCVDGTPTVSAECESAITQYTTCMSQ